MNTNRNEVGKIKYEEEKEDEEEEVSLFGKSLDVEEKRREILRKADVGASADVERQLLGRRDEVIYLSVGSRSSVGSGSVVILHNVFRVSLLASGVDAATPMTPRCYHSRQDISTDGYNVAGSPLGFAKRP
ncbi:hypothetical protein M0804_003470 [Polistes exclamans]|nr:hypothetical protein M0804_003470 [Polistes exclamans]